jgi:plastocyanin
MRVTIPVAAALIFALACGGGSDTTAPSSGGSTSEPLTGLVKVNIRDFSFTPATVTIKAGATVMWTNLGPSPHTTVSDNGVWTSGTLGSPTSGGSGYGGGGSSGGTFQSTFTQAGTFGYHCNLHPPSQYPTFVGTITVVP